MNGGMVNARYCLRPRLKTSKTIQLLGSFMYHVCWSLVRSIGMGIVIWLAMHEASVDEWKSYMLLCINILVLDAAIKDFRYGSWKTCCHSTCCNNMEQHHEGRSLVV